MDRMRKCKGVTIFLGADHNVPCVGSSALPGLLHTYSFYPALLFTNMTRYLPGWAIPFPKTDFTSFDPPPP